MGELSKEISGMSTGKDIIPSIHRIRELINELDVIAETELRASDFELYSAIYQASISIRGSLFDNGYFDLIIQHTEKKE